LDNNDFYDARAPPNVSLQDNMGAATTTSAASYCSLLIRSRNLNRRALDRDLKSVRQVLRTGFLEDE